MNTLKPGIKTTEFWLTLLGAIALALAPLPTITIGTALPVALPVIFKSFGISGLLSAYTISRGLAKQGS